MSRERKQNSKVAIPSAQEGMQPVQPPQLNTMLRRKSRRVTEILQRLYGSPDHNNKQDPLDETIFIILSLMTTHQSFNRVYDHVKATIPAWDDVLRLPAAQLEELIKDAGLSRQKAPRIQSILTKLEKDFGRVSMDALIAMSDESVEDYLTSLPGIGTKAAKCVMMYSLGRQVLPVDTHVWRVAKRLGLVPLEITYKQVHQALEANVSPRDRYSFHVNAIAHGRALCSALRPRCSRCPLNRVCVYPDKTRMLDATLKASK